MSDTENVNESANEQDTAVEATHTDNGADADSLGEGGLKALKAEREARAAAEKQLREAQARVEAFEDEKRSEAERAQHELEKLRGEAEALKAEKLRLERDALASEVAAEVGLPAGLVSRLRGESRDELVEDARSLAAEVAPAARKPVPVSALGGSNEPKPSPRDAFASVFQSAFG